MDAGDFTMTSLGKCSYEFLETFNIRDVGLGYISYSRSAMAALRNSGVKDELTHHYAKIRLTPGLSHSVLVTISLLPYGESVYVDTVSLQSESWAGLVTAIFAYVSSALGDRVGDRVLHHQFRKITEWLESVATVAAV